MATTVTVLRKIAWKDEKGSYRRWVYRVQFDATPSDPADALVATGIPDIGDNYTGSTTIKCRRVGDATEVGDSRTLYEVPVEFSDVSDGRSGGTGTIDPDPLSRPAQIEWGFEVIERVAEKDRDGNAIVNAAGDAFDPPLKEEVYRLVCLITRNVTSHSPADAYAKINTVNSNSMTIAGVSVAAGQALMKDYSASAVYEAGVSYAQQHFAIVFAPTFSREVANLGYYYLSSGDRLRFKDDEGKDDTEPHFLDGSGGDGGGTPDYLTFNTKEETNWSGLALPTTFPDV